MSSYLHFGSPFITTEHRTVDYGGADGFQEVIKLKKQGVDSVTHGLRFQSLEPPPNPPTSIAERL